MRRTQCLGGATFIKNKYHVETGKLKTAPGVNHNVAEMQGSADDRANRSNELHVEGFIVFLRDPS